MFKNLSSGQYALIVLVIIIAVFIVLLLLPAILELLRPKDAGPRKIEDKDTEDEE